MPKPLSTAFREALALPPSESSSELDVALARYVEAARAAWPHFGLKPADFVRYLAERAPAGELPPERHAADLWLACACVQGLAPAMACFFREYESLVLRVVRKRGGAEDLAADVRQMLAEKFLVGDARTGRRARIADYKGLGALRSWVATAAATTLATQRRDEGRRRDGVELLANKGFSGRLDPELDYLKQRYAQQVHDAIAEALAASSTRDKALLRLHLEKRLSIDQLGVMYGVNRATAARWLVAARRTVKRRTIESLRASLELDPQECESLLGLVKSQLDVSMLNHLEYSAKPPDAQLPLAQSPDAEHPDDFENAPDGRAPRG